MKQWFPGFRFGSLVHSGNRVQVVRAVNRNTNARVILKVLRSEHPPLRDVARLRHEYELLKLFDTDRMIRTQGLLRNGPRVAIILEDFGGTSLREHVVATGIDFDFFIWLALQATEAIGEVHRAGVLHKDIKPDNMIVDLHTKRLALIDLSIASKLSQERRQPVAPDVLEGSLSYLSPEQTGRMNRPVDYRSDFYSLGITFYELLTGVTPFRAHDALELIHAHIARRPVAPREVRADVPEVLSDIVMRLLAKNAEERYQSSRGLLADLRQFADARDVTFDLGKNDRSERFRVSTALVGREPQLQSLTQAFERVCVGGNETVLISGTAGIGKSALVHELQRSLAAQRGAFIAGKFDALAHRSPYAALATALRQLVLNLLGAPATVLDTWRAAISEAVGQNGQLLVEMIPELEVLLGPQPAVPTMPMAEAADRFQSVLRRFIAALAREDHPLVIFLDDLQWADLATLKLIEDLGADFELAYVLWIGTYRNDEVPPEHPLWRMRQALVDAQAALTSFLLTPLDPAAVTQIVRASLQASGSDDVEPLAQMIHARSHGNPFFIRALLTTLHEADILHFDRDRGRWTWELDEVASASLPDDVISLVTRRLQDLKREGRKLLRVAAGIGGHFDVHLLSHVSGVAATDAVADLWEAVTAGLVRPIGDDYKYVDDEVHRVEFEFVHDRVQQAAYALLDPEEKMQLHLAIGTQLATQGHLDDETHLFAIAGHFSAAGPIIVEPEKRLEAARLMLRAARRAKTSTAYHEACVFLDAGVQFLADDPWRNHPNLIASLATAQVECEYLAGRPKRAIEIFEPLLAHTVASRDRARLHALRATLETNRGDLITALQAGRNGLQQLGRRLPKKASTLSVLRAYARFQHLQRGPATTILDLPPLVDPDRIAELRVLMSMAAAAYFLDTNLASVILLRIANISLKHGLSDVSAYGFIGAGLVMAGAFGRYRQAYALAEVAHTLNNRFANAELSAKILLFSTTFMMVWVRPFPEVVRNLREATQIASSNGDFIYGIYSAVTEAFVMVIDGSTLQRIDAHCESLMPLLRRRGLADQIATITYMRHLFGRLLQSPEGRDEEFDEVAFCESISDEKTPLVMFYYHLYVALKCYLLVDQKGAMAALEQAQTRTKVAFGSAIIADFRFYEGMILARELDSQKGSTRRAMLRRLKGCRKALAKWAETAPENFGARASLLHGELSRLCGDEGAALRHYNEAIAEARQHQMLHIEAIAAECAVRFASTQHYPILTRAYLAESIRAYRSWGALAKVRALVGEFDEYSVQSSHLATVTSKTQHSVTATTTVALDLDTVIQVSRVISGELAMDRLLTKLATLLVENAGARRGVLLLNFDEELRVAAEAQTQADGVEVELHDGLVLADYENLAHTLVNRVARTKTDIILNDAIHDPVFAAEPYIVANHVRSLLCIPVTHHGTLAGILYLENDLAAGAFTMRRLALVKQLAAQFAISVTNAHLYRSLDDARRAALTADRVKTRFLMNMSHELRTPLNAILGYTELMAENLADGDTSGLDEDLRGIHRAGMRLLRSVSSLLELTRIEADARTALPVAIDLGELLTSLTEAFKDSAARHGNHFRIEAPTPMPSLTTDEHMLRYALATVLDNACRFTSHGAITVRVATFEHRRAPWLCIAVEDEGQGIDEASISNVFNAFYQVDDSPSRRFEGTGVSLAVTARFCERLGGEITVESTPDVGSVFRIRIPQKLV